MPATVLETQEVSRKPQDAHSIQDSLIHLDLLDFGLQATDMRLWLPGSFFGVNEMAELEEARELIISPRHCNHRLSDITSSIRLQKLSGGRLPAVCG